MSEDDLEEGFNRAVTGYELFGVALRPYSTSRKDAAELMGLQYPFLSGEDTDRLIKTNRYPALKRDVAIVLWLCQLKDAMDSPEPGEWTPERAFINATGAIMEAMAWANSQEWGDTKSPRFLEAATVALAIVLDKSVSEFYVKVDSGPKAEKKMGNTKSQAGRKQPPASHV